jgi:hypothetical protein
MAIESMPGDSEAGDQLAAPPQVGDMASGITVPREYLPNCKVGDTYTVKSADGDNVVLEDSKGPDDESYNADMVNAMKEGDANE